MHKLFIVLLMLPIVFFGCTSTTVSPGETHLLKEHKQVDATNDNTRHTTIKVYPKISIFSLDQEGMPYVKTTEDLNNRSPSGNAELSIPLKGGIMKIPQGYGVEIDEIDSTDATPKIEENKTTADAKGAGITSDSSDVVGKVKETPPSSTLGNDESSASGGGLSYDFKILAGVSKGSNILLIIGAIAIIAGALILGFLKDIKWGAISIGLGLLFISTALVYEKYPWVLLLVFLGVIGAGVVFVLDLLNKKKTDTTLNTVVKAVANAPDNVANTIKENITNSTSGKTQDVVKDQITKVKRKLGL